MSLRYWWSLWSCKGIPPMKPQPIQLFLLLMLVTSWNLSALVGAAGACTYRQSQVIRWQLFFTALEIQLLGYSFSWRQKQQIEGKNIFFNYSKNERITTFPNKFTSPGSALNCEGFQWTGKASACYLAHARGRCAHGPWQIIATRT